MKSQQDEQKQYEQQLQEGPKGAKKEPKRLTGNSKEPNKDSQGKAFS